MWPDPPLWGKLFMHPVGIPNAKLVTKFEVCRKNNFLDIWDSLQQILGVTWPRPRPFWKKLLARPLSFSKRKLCTKFEVSSSSSFEDRFDCMPKILGVTWPKTRPFWGILFEHPLGFSNRKLCTKFEVSSSSSFEDRFDRIPKILGVTWPIQVCQDLAVWQIWSVYVHYLLFYGHYNVKQRHVDENGHCACAVSLDL